jgi:dTDP-4-dehydrorhamnose reductase
MRVAVTGRNGQVVRSLLERGRDAGHEIMALGRPVLELAADPDVIADAIEAARPDVVVSAAAYSAVDKAEREPKLAFAINERGAGAVGRAARLLGVPLVHLSTDYVFDGVKSVPYAEEDAPDPTGVYGASKLAGEAAVQAAHANSAILRTAWVYSPFAVNFVKTMLHLASVRDEVAVVADQLGNPTSALDIADGVLAVAANLVRASDAELRGIFHMTAAGEASWAEFAEAIFAAADREGGPSARVKHIATIDYPTAARRPANSRLNCGKLARTHGIRLPDWRSSTETVVHRLVDDQVSGGAR